MKVILYNWPIDLILLVIKILNCSLNQEYLSLICPLRSQSGIIQTKVYTSNGPFLCGFQVPLRRYSKDHSTSMIRCHVIWQKFTENLDRLFAALLLLQLQGTNVGTLDTCCLQCHFFGSEYSSGQYRYKEMSSCHILQYPDLKSYFYG